MRMCRIFFLLAFFLAFGLSSVGSAEAQTASAEYVGSDRCATCHSTKSSGWKETVHANIYREPTVDTVIGDFDSAPAEFTVGDATLTVTFDDNGGSGPWSMNLKGAGFDSTYTVHRAHGGFRVDENEDAVLPDAPGRRYYIGKQRYHTKIGSSYFILPAQWNPFADRDGGNQGWVAYHTSDWMDANGDLILATKASEERRCMGCHQVGAGPTVNAGGEYVLAEADNPSFWNIGCESCHGPGSEHASGPSQSNITNPADLTIAKQNEVCGACHLRPTGHPIPDGDASPGYPYASELGGTYRPGADLEDYIAQDSGGYWPDGTSKKHHQQYPDFQKSKHIDTMSCMTCHHAHNETSDEHDLTMTARDNSLCTQCHASYKDENALSQHTNHSVDLDAGLGRCVDCHMPAVQKSGVNYDIHAHTFQIMSPQTTLDTQADGGTPNSCAVSCHADELLGAPMLGVSGGKLGTWNEAADVALANKLLGEEEPTAPITALHKAVVTVTLTDAGSPVSGAEVAFSRSTSGKAPAYTWMGTTNGSGQVEIEIIADPIKDWRRGVSGYYLAKATNAGGTVVGTWGSIPINGGKELSVSLPVGGAATVETGDMLAFALAGASPNPFNPSTQISYQIGAASDVQLVIYNALGQEVRVLVNSSQDAGRHQVVWDGTDAIGNQVASGAYIYRLMNGSNVATGRMLFLK